MHFNIVPKQVLSNLLSVLAVNRKSALGRKVCDAFFTNDKEDNTTWHCFCVVKRKQTGIGYTNLLSQVQGKHPSELRKVRETDESLASTNSATPETRMLEMSVKDSFFFQP